jgi:hypothetical protein
MRLRNAKSEIRKSKRLDRCGQSCELGYFDFESPITSFEFRISSFDLRVASER